jgi:hypothetical protein
MASASAIERFFFHLGTVPILGELFAYYMTRRKREREEKRRGTEEREGIAREERDKETKIYREKEIKTETHTEKQRLIPPFSSDDTL